MSALLTARDVCQRLREAALGRLSLTHVDGPLTANHIWLDLEGWKLQVEFDGQRLHHCKQCRCPDGKEWVFGSSQFFGTDPISLLSTWELAQIEVRLATSAQ